SAFARDPERIDVRFVAGAANSAPAWTAKKATLAAANSFSSSTTDGDSFSIGSVDESTGHVTYSIRPDAIEYDLCGSGPGQLHLGSLVISAGVCITVSADRAQSVLENSGRIDGIANA